MLEKFKDTEETLKVLCYEAEKNLQNTKESLRKSAFNILETSVEEAKKAGVDVSDIEGQMPELEKKVLCYEAEKNLQNTKESLRKSAFNILETSVEEAKKAGVDVSDIEGQMPELEKKVLCSEAEKNLQNTKESLRKNAFNILETSVEEAKKAGVDVSDIEGQMPELEKKVLCSEAEKNLQNTKESLRKNAFNILETSVEEAKKAGVDVSDIEGQMPELEKKVLCYEAEKNLQNTKESLRKSAFNILETSVEEAKKAGVDVSDIEGQMPELEKKVLCSEAEKNLQNTKESLRKNAFNILETSVEEAKKAGVDVSDIEGQMPDLRKNLEK